jgi:stress response protein YsnF
MHDEYENYANRTLVDSSGAKVGIIEEVYVDYDTQKPEWALVRTGLVGVRKSFVPLSELRMEGDSLRAPYAKDQITGAPNVDEEEEISPEAEKQLFQHYGLSYTGAGTVSREEGDRHQTQAAGHETPAASRETRETSGATEVERSEEELRVGKVRRPSELVRIRKRVETEPVGAEVELEQEQVRIVREPVGEAEAGTAGRIGEMAEREIRLEREEPVVEKEVVAKERVRLEKDVTTERRKVKAEVRKERVDVERRDDPSRS